MQIPSFLTMATLLILVSGESIAQTDIFPGLAGDDLLEALVDEYKPKELLSIAQAKDTLYSRVEMHEDSVRGIYTDFALYLPPGQDPSQALFMDGSGINLEHSWPQSKGAGDGKPGQRDMHHLFPSRVLANSSRASFPYGDIYDSNTETWYYRDINRTTTPSMHIERYSESINGRFEPRESVKGDIARALLYFYTMYKDDADNADPDFFELQRATLCTWHYEDPVDENELSRTQRIASYQDNKINPFIMDCTLAERLYCPDGGQCGTVAVTSNSHSDIDMRMIQFGCNINIIANSKTPARITNSIINSRGQVLHKRDIALTEGENVIDFDACHLPPGIYFLNSIIVSTRRTTIKTIKFVIIGLP